MNARAGEVSAPAFVLQDGEGKKSNTLHKFFKKRLVSDFISQDSAIWTCGEFPAR